MEQNDKGRYSPGLLSGSGAVLMRCACRSPLVVQFELRDLVITVLRNVTLNYHFWELIMKIRELIDAAVKHSGQTQGEIAAELMVKPARLSEWKSGDRKPDANEIAFFAEKAGLPVLETLAEVEAELDARYSHIWAKALGNLRAAGIAATVTMAPLTSSAIEAVSRVVKS